MVRQRKTIPLLAVGCPVRRKFENFCGLVGEPFGVRLPIPKFDYETESERLTFLKKFCGGLLEDPRKHLWHTPLARLGKDARMSISMSLFLFRKCLPSAAPDLVAYVERMAQPSEDPDPDFLRFVERRVNQLFPVGWDRSKYESACLNAVLPVKACRQQSRAEGGARSYGMSNYWNTHQDYVLDVLTREAPVELLPSRVISVETGGKHRIVSKSDVSANLFRPLHTAMYNHLSKFPWLLRGEAKPSRFTEFITKKGEVFVSGDYESATDNLNGHLQRRMLDIILANAVSVPIGIKLGAPQMLSTVLEVRREDGSDLVARQERGQLMGNLLSFPLLCLVNYLGFRFFSGCKGPVRINGDDIVFRGTPQEAERWMKGVRRAGLTLSLGKTLVDARYFSLNSMMFKSRDGKPYQIPMIRSTAFGYRPDCGGLESVAGRFRSFAPGFFGDRRRLLNVRFLQWNRKYICAGGRSLTRGLGMKVSREELARSGLLSWEDHFLSLEKEWSLPARPATLEQNRIPAGWKLRTVEKITKEIREISRQAGPEFVQCAWSEITDVTCAEQSEREWKRAVWETSNAPPVQSSLRRRARLLGLSPRNTARLLRARLYDERLRSLQRQNRCRVWLPDNGARPAAGSDATRSVKYDIDKSFLGNKFDPIEYSASVQCETLWTRDGECVGFGFRPPPNLLVGVKLH